MDWPATLPCIQLDPYRVVPRSPVLENDWGHLIRRRVTFSDLVQEVEIQFVMDGQQQADFRTFYDVTTEMGTLPFNMPLEIEGSYQTKEVRFIGDPPSYVPVAPGYAEVSATILVSP